VLTKAELAYMYRLLVSARTRRSYALLRKHFDRHFYLATYPDVHRAGMNPIVHYCVTGWRDGLNPCRDFDTLYYRGANPDVEKDHHNPFTHYLRHGRKEGRRPLPVDETERQLAIDYLVIAPELDKEFYLSQYPDIAAAGIDPVKHFIEAGWSEFRNPRANFITSYYYYNNKEVIPDNVNPFRHYIERGRQEGLAPSAEAGCHPHLFLKYDRGLVTSLDAVPSVRPCEENDYCLRVPFEFAIEVPDIGPVAAIVHVYYTHLLPKIVTYLANIPFRTDLFISTDTESKKSEILTTLVDYSKGTVEVRVFENRGRDIAPFIVGFSDILHRYEYFIHLHTKRSPHGGDPLAQWLDYLLESLLGSEKIVASIVHLMLFHNVGIAFPQHMLALRGILNWGHDFDLAAALVGRAGHTLDKMHLLEFPSGSMFWGRTAALRPLLDLRLQPADFQDEAGQMDGTLAHAIERAFLYLAEVAGCRWAKILSGSIEYPFERTVLACTSEPDVSHNLALTYRPLLLKQLSGITTTEKSIPQVRSIIFSPSWSRRPRVNLLVPTINPTQVFGGVSTALRIFAELESLYGHAADFRIIVTDAPTRPEAFALFATYEFGSLSVHDTEAPRVIVDARERNLAPLAIRESDIFVATAWWTAHLGFEAIDAQKRLFHKGSMLVYLIQDFEPDFYGWSSRWVLAENTLKRGSETIAIINSTELRDFLSRQYAFKHAYYLRYAMDDAIRLDPASKKQKLMLVYGRPSVSRNLFELAMDGIGLWQQRNPHSARDWKIVSVGEDYPLESAAPLSNLEVLGKLGLEAYGGYLSRASVGLSLMLSPHPSYPPLEMAAAGIVTVTNACFGKDLGREGDNIISLAVITPETIADAIGSAIARVSATPHPAEDLMAAQGRAVRPSAPAPGKDRSRQRLLANLLQRPKPEPSPQARIFDAAELGRVLKLGS
jgi:hypothetical protein